MNAFDRGLLIIYSLAGTAAALFCTAALGGMAWPSEFYAGLRETPGFWETAYALLAIAVLAGLRIIWMGLSPGKKHAVVQDGSLGQIRIALEAIESLVEKITTEQRGIKEAKAVVESTSNGIGIRVKTVVAPDVSIPQLSGDLQKIILDKVLAVTGIEVRDIRILVHNISSQKVRVE